MTRYDDGAEFARTLVELDEALAVLGRKLAQCGEPPLELHILGGYALALRGLRLGGATEDIDTATPDFNPVVARCIRETAAELGLKEDWLNNDCVLAWDDGVSEDDVAAHDMMIGAVYELAPRPGIPSNITVRVADAATLARSKAYAADAIGMGRDEKDALDLLAALGAIGVTSRADLDRKAPWLDPQEFPVARKVAERGLAAFERRAQVEREAREQATPQTEAKAAYALAVARGAALREGKRLPQARSL